MVSESKIALYNATSGQSLSKQDLEDKSNQVAHLFRNLGLLRGSHVALWMENCFEFFIVARGAERAGLYLTPISTHLTGQEATYIANDCGAECFITSNALLEKLSGDLTLDIKHRFTVGESKEGLQNLDEALSSMPTAPVEDQSTGSIMFYSSGTTGRPKGIKKPLPDNKYGEPTPLVQGIQIGYGIDDQTVYLSPAPLYHAAPLTYSMATLCLGGTIVFVEKFDAEKCLESIEKYKVSHAQFVPTMFIRMLSLDEEIRNRFDLSSLQNVAHAAAPCPIDVKRAMIDWFGPIIVEYYSGSEGCGATFISSEEWLKNPGSVGRAVVGKIHIVDEEGVELPTGEIGSVYFSEGPSFEYHNDAGKTEAAHSKKGWATMGDVGFLNEEGYLFLTDRKDFMILSGGVNIYPQEIENTLIMHPSVKDVAVIGVPNEEFGEEVKAVVELKVKNESSKQLVEVLTTYCRERMSGVKCPRSIDFVDALPRTETGKLLKKTLQLQYREAHKKHVS